MLNSENKFLSIYRKALLWGAIGLAEYHLLWSLMQFVIWDKPYLKLEKWGGFALIAGVVLYIVIAAVLEKKAPAAGAASPAESAKAPAAAAGSAGSAKAAGEPADKAASPAESAKSPAAAAGSAGSAAAGEPAGSAKAAAATPLAGVRELARRAKSPEQIFLVVFFVWYIIVCAIRTAMEGTSYFATNDNRMFYAALTTFLFFPFVEIVGREKVKKIVEVMLNSAVAAYTPVCAWVLWNFYHGVFVKLPSGNEVKLYKGLSLMIGVHRNTTAAYSLILLSICVYMLLTMKSKIKYVIYIPAAVVHFFVIMLTNSRTCYIVFIAMIVFPVIVRGMKYLKRIKVKNKALVGAGVVLVLVAGVAALYFLRSGIIASNAEMWREKLNNPDAMRVRKMSGLNGRVNIWIASVKLMFSSWDRFLFGVTPPKLPGILWEIGQFPVKQPNCHDMFLQVGTCFGVPMMLMYIWFSVKVMLRGLRVMRYEGGKLFKTAWFIPVIVFGLLMTDTMEVLTFVNSFFNLPVFYILAGWIVAMDKILAAEKGQNNY